MSRFPGLKFLDSCEVTEEERGLAKQRYGNVVTGLVRGEVVEAVVDTAGNPFQRERKKKRRSKRADSEASQLQREGQSPAALPPPPPPPPPPKEERERGEAVKEGVKEEREVAPAPAAERPNLLSEIAAAAARRNSSTQARPPVLPPPGPAEPMAPPQRSHKASQPPLPPVAAVVPGLRGVTLPAVQRGSSDGDEANRAGHANNLSDQDLGGFDTEETDSESF